MSEQDCKLFPTFYSDLLNLIHYVSSASPVPPQVSLHWPTFISYAFSKVFLNTFGAFLHALTKVTTVLPRYIEFGIANSSQWIPPQVSSHWPTLISYAFSKVFLNTFGAPFGALTEVTIVLPRYIEFGIANGSQWKSSGYKSCMPWNAVARGFVCRVP